MSKSGWVWPMNFRKAHYVVDGRSLCGRMMYLGDLYEQGNDASLDNCARCKTLLARRHVKDEGKDESI